MKGWKMERARTCRIRSRVRCACQGLLGLERGRGLVARGVEEGSAQMWWLGSFISGVLGV
jgi:hypothetical protein